MANRACKKASSTTLLREPVLLTIGGDYAHKYSGSRPDLTYQPSDCNPLNGAVSNYIVWENWGIPKKDAEWWVKQRNIILANDRIEHVHLSCGHGHGRSGTMALIMVQLLQPFPSIIDALKYIRSRHCSHAIENPAQMEYAIRMVMDAEEILLLPSTTGYEPEEV